MIHFIFAKQVQMSNDVNGIFDDTIHHILYICRKLIEHLYASFTHLKRITLFTNLHIGT